VQLLGALLQWAERLLQALARGLQFELAQLLLDGGFAPTLLVLGQALLAEALLLRPELFLDETVLGGATPLVRLPLLFDSVDAAAFFGGAALLGQELRAGCITPTR